MNVLRSSPYDKNAFRILGLSVSAKSRDLRRRAADMRLERELAGADSVELDRIRTASAVLEDPVLRLAEELYWIHLTPDSVPPNLDVGQEAHVSSAISALTPLASAGSDEALHDLAIIHHAAAIVGENPSDWRAGVSLWKQVFDNDAFWLRMLMRAEDLGDPRLTPASVDSLRRDLPAKVLAPTSEIIGRLLDEGRASIAAQHLRVIVESEFPKEAVERARAEATVGTCLQVKATLQDISSLLEAVSSNGSTLCWDDIASVLREAKQRAQQYLLPKVEQLKLVDSGQGDVEVLCDEVSELLRSLAIRINNQCDDVDGAIPLAEAAERIAGSHSTRHRLNNDLATLRFNAASKKMLDYVEKGLWGSALTAAQEAWRLAPDVEQRTFIESVMGRCRNELDSRSAPTNPTHGASSGPRFRLRWVLAPVLVLVLYSCFTGSKPSSSPTMAVNQSPKNTGTATMSVPNAQAPTQSPSIPKKPEDNPIRQDQSKQNRNLEKERMLNRLRALNSQIDSERPSIDLIESELNSQEGDIERLEERMRNIRDRYQNDGAPPDVVDQYNSMRRRLNSQIDDYNARLADYKSALAAFNSKVDEYNELVTKLKVMQ